MQMLARSKSRRTRAATAPTNQRKLITRVAGEARARSTQKPARETGRGAGGAAVCRPASPNFWVCLVALSSGFDRFIFQLFFFCLNTRHQSVTPMPNSMLHTQLHRIECRLQGGAHPLRSLDSGTRWRKTDGIMCEVRADAESRISLGMP